MHHALVKLAHFDDEACFVSLVGVRACLVLKPNAVTDSKWGEMATVCSESLCGSHMAVPQCFFSVLKSVCPCGMGMIFPRVDRDEIPDWMAEDA